MVGVAAGLAMSGYRPIVEVMFGDFISLAFDQIVNHVTKFSAMYDRKVTCPVVIRVPSGGHRGYGPTHSQSLEKHFLGVPELTVAAASIYHDPAQIFAALLQREVPALYIEHKLLYPEPLVLQKDGRVGTAIGREEASAGALPTVVMSQVPSADCALTVLAYGYTALLAARALEELAIEEEIFGELLVPAQLSPIDWAPIQRSVEVTGSLVTVEEGMSGWSWGTQIAAELPRRSLLRKPVEVVASTPGVIPSSREREREVLVGLERIKSSIRQAAA
jgi:pyruvate/2-oxoglutarate/acetoin dehydrogenase E1 component